MKTLKLFALVCTTFATMPVKADIAPTVMLHHGGAVKTYMYNEVQTAVNDAVDGDTIFLTEGTFNSFNVNKRILVRGAGPTTLIDGNCIINISGTEKLNMPVLDAMSFTGTVQINSAYKQFTLRKIRTNHLLFRDTENYYDVKLDRCHIAGQLKLTNNVKEFNAFGSLINQLYPTDYKGGKVTFEHCNIVEICDTISGATFNSCFLYLTTRFIGAKSTYNLLGCVLNSCVHSAWNDDRYICGTNCVFLNDYGFSGSLSNAISFNGVINNNTIYSALDGTIVGAFGGQHPFNLYPEVPGVTKHQITIDAATRKMTVKLTVNKLDK